jgi:hypothetical protein
VTFFPGPVRCHRARLPLASTDSGRADDHGHCGAHELVHPGLRPGTVKMSGVGLAATRSRVTCCLIVGPAHTARFWQTGWYNRHTRVFPVRPAER